MPLEESNVRCLGYAMTYNATALHTHNVTQHYHILRLNAHVKLTFVFSKKQLQKRNAAAYFLICLKTAISLALKGNIRCALSIW